MPKVADPAPPLPWPLHAIDLEASLPEPAGPAGHRACSAPGPAVAAFAEGMAAMPLDKPSGRLRHRTGGRVYPSVTVFAFPLRRTA